MKLIDSMCQEKKEKKNAPALKISCMLQYDDSKTIKKEQRETNDSDQKQQWQYKNKQNSNYLKTEMGRKRLYGLFEQQTNEISHQKNWT